MFTKQMVGLFGQGAAGGGGGTVISIDVAQVNSDLMAADQVTGVTYNTGDRVYLLLAVFSSTGSTQNFTSVTGGANLGSWARVTDGTQGALNNSTTVTFELWAATASGNASSQTITVVWSAGTIGDTATTAAGIAFSLKNVAAGNPNKITTATANISVGQSVPTPSITTSVGSTQILVVGAVNQVLHMDCTTLTGYTELGFPSTSLSMGAGLQTAANGSSGTFSPGSFNSNSTGTPTYYTMSIALVHT